MILIIYHFSVVLSYVNLFMIDVPCRIHQRSWMSLAQDIRRCYSTEDLEKTYDATIFTFDLDKTYLVTEFEHFWKLVKIPFEKAKQKKNVPGTASLVRELNKRDAPVFFVSGSPKGMRNVIEEKLHLDGIQFNGLLLKDYGEALKKMKIGKIIDKIGYKLAALLYARMVYPSKANEILFGDDSEYDATIYSLYSDIISGKLYDFQILSILKRWGVYPEEFDLIREHLIQFNKTFKNPKFVVRKIFIHLEKKTSPQDHMTFSDKVTPTYNYFQTSLILYKMNHINRQGLFRIISNLTKKYHFNINSFIFSVQDLLSRGLLEKKEGKKILNMVLKGNPLALPLRILNELKIESNRVLESFTKAPFVFAKKPLEFLKTFKDGEKQKEPNSNNLFLKYLSYSPKRNV